MKDFIIPVNNEAHSRALVAVVGEETAALVLKAYQAIDSAMVFAYERSQAEEAEKRKVLAEEYVAALQRSEDRDTKDAFKQGYDTGYKAAEDAGALEAYHRAEYDDGYTDGVSDFRIWGNSTPEGVSNAQAQYDDGYVDGVSDARACPADADREVARLCSEDEVQYDNDTFSELRDTF
jgi:hypothetical protein